MISRQNASVERTWSKFPRCLRLPQSLRFPDSTAPLELLTRAMTSISVPTADRRAHPLSQGTFFATFRTR
jgi:hypothetical protein